MSTQPTPALSRSLWSRLGTREPTLTRGGFLRAAAAGLFATGAAGSLAACGAADSASGGGFTYASILPFDTLTFIPEMMGTAGGYLSDQGVDMKVEIARGTAQAMQTVLAGKAPVVRPSMIDLATARTTAKQPLVAIGTVMRGPSVVLNYAKNDALDDPTKLVGKTVGIPSKGGTSEQTLLLMLTDAGVDPDDVKRQVVGQSPSTWELVRRGQLAGFISGIDVSLIIQSQYDDAAALDPGKYSSIQSTTQIYVTTEDAVQKQADKLTGFLSAIRASMQAVIDDQSRAKSIQTLRKKYHFATLDDDAIAKRAFDVYVDLWTTQANGRQLLETDQEKWVAGIEKLQKLGYISGVSKPETWMTNDLLKA